LEISTPEKERERIADRHKSGDFNVRERERGGERVIEA
jgi:hypothetical protein